MILGNVCTRQCRFCAVHKGVPLPLDMDEPERVAQAASRLQLRHVVITSVTRDDLPDGGAWVFAHTIRAIHARLPQSRVEVLTPDFKGAESSLLCVLNEAPDVFNHNLETVRRIQKLIRPAADYDRSLNVLRFAADFRDKTDWRASQDTKTTGCLRDEMRPSEACPSIGCEPPAKDTLEANRHLRVKSGIMVGLGETDEEIRCTLQDLRHAGCELVTIGQYLAPSIAHIPVSRFVLPCQFDKYAKWALEMGFRGVASAPLVRSSYHAGEQWASAEASGTA